MKPNRIIVAGGRDVSDIELMEEKLDHLLQKRSPEDTAIISGMANGADTLGTHWAEQHGLEVMRFPADWTMYGRSAGYKRNHRCWRLQLASSPSGMAGRAGRVT